MYKKWSRGDLEILTVCPACNSSSVICDEYCRQDDVLDMPDFWRIVSCADCYSLYLNPRPDKNSLARAYENYYTHSSEIEPLITDKEKGLVAALINGYLNWRFRMQRRPALVAGALIFSAIFPFRMKLDIYGRHLPKSMCGPDTHLLDVGCGSGSFVRRALEMGVTAEGCDPDERAVAACLSQGLSVIRGDIYSERLDGKQFDVITLNHVVEHVSDPCKFLERLYELLVPGGLLWIALPNPNSLGLTLFGRGWKGLHPPYHLVIPQRNILYGWLVQAKFTEMKFIRRGLDSPGLWCESKRISRREGTLPSWAKVALTRAVSSLLMLFSARWGEETIVTAYKPR